MPAVAGRDMVVSKDATAIMGARTKSVNFSAEPIDIGSGEDDGNQLFLAGASTGKAVELPIEGVWKDSILRDAALGGGDLLLTDITVDIAGGETLSGNFFLSAYSETGEYQDAVMFSATLRSSGAVTVS